MVSVGRTKSLLSHLTKKTISSIICTKAIQEVKRTLAALTALMLLPTTVMASSIRPGSRVTHKSLNSSPSSKYDGALCKKDDRFSEKCDIIIDDTGVRGPEGHITNVVRWSSKEDAPSAGGAVAGAAGGAIVGGAAGIGTCFLVGPLCLITAPAIMGGGMGTGAEWGAKSGARTFTIVGDDAQGNRIIQFFKVKRSGVEKTEEQLLLTTKLAEGEIR